MKDVIIVLFSVMFGILCFSQSKDVLDAIVSCISCILFFEYIFLLTVLILKKI